MRSSGKSFWRCMLCWGIMISPAVGAETHAYGSTQNCILSGRLDATKCANAAANAQAEYEERAPRFASREACERIFAAAGCSPSLRGGEAFSPRQAGFRVVVMSWREQTTTPIVAGPKISFQPRSILRRDVYVHPKVARFSPGSWSAPPSSGEGAGVDDREERGGLVHPSHEKLPPRPPVDKNFDCAAVLEPSERDHADTACYLAPARRR
jgi:hypothetical protein